MKVKTWSSELWVRANEYVSDPVRAFEILRFYKVNTNKGMLKFEWSLKFFDAIISFVFPDSNEVTIIVFQMKFFAIKIAELSAINSF